MANSRFMDWILHNLKKATEEKYLEMKFYQEQTVKIFQRIF